MTHLVSEATEQADLPYAHGWKRWIVAIAVGALAALALPPIHAVFVLLLCIPVLLLLLKGCSSAAQSFWISWCFGFGRGLIGYYWISNALLVAPERFGWMIPFAVGGLAAVTATFAGLAGLGLYSLTRLKSSALKTSGWRYLVAFAALWVLAEWVQSWIFTGFPWNFMGTVWTAAPAMLQLASVGGVYLLSLVTLLLAGLPFAWLKATTKHQKRCILLGGPVVLGLIWGGGMIRLHGTANSQPASDVVVRLVQPNIAQTLKWDPAQREDNLQRLIELSTQPAAGTPPAVVIWPETAVPFFLEEDINHRRLAMQAVPSRGLLLTGIVRRSPPDAQTFQIWNSLQAFDEYGTVHGVYDKAHLVPFGEYVPLGTLLPLQKITPGSTSFSAGPGPRTLSLPGLPPMGVLICYEIIFPGAVVDPENRPAWILNVTNDGWYGISTGPYQHLASAQLRAVEEGVPVIRVANTGISAVIDSFGRIIYFLPLGDDGIIDSTLPNATDISTFYSTVGNSAPLLLCILLIGMAGFCKQPSRKNS